MRGRMHVLMRLETDARGARVEGDVGATTCDTVLGARTVVDGDSSGAGDSYGAVSGTTIVVAGAAADPGASSATDARRLETVRVVVAETAPQRNKKAVVFIPFREDPVPRCRRRKSSYASRATTTALVLLLRPGSPIQRKC